MFLITSCQRSMGTDRKTDRRENEEEEGRRKCKKKQAKSVVNPGLNRPPSHSQSNLHIHGHRNMQEHPSPSACWQTIEVSQFSGRPRHLRGKMGCIPICFFLSLQAMPQAQMLCLCAGFPSTFPRRHHWISAMPHHPSSSLFPRDLSEL